MARRTFSRPVVRGKKRAVTWIVGADDGSSSISGNTNTILQSRVIAQDETVVRSRGGFLIRPTVVTADLDIVGALGIAVVSDQAFGAGAASIPGPWTNGSWDEWYVWQPFALHLEFTVDDTNFLSGVWFPFDSKAMRKSSAGDTQVIMVESQGAAFSIMMGWRQLIKLP